MITRHSPRAHLLVLLCMLSFAAAILAATAYAGQDFYCNGCTLSSSGVPATSGSTNHIANGMQLAVAADWHHYQYNISTGVTSCQRSGTNGFGSFLACPGTNTSSRCHLLNGTGPRVATCRTDT